MKQEAGTSACGINPIIYLKRRLQEEDVYMAAVNKYIREELSLFSEAFAAMALWMEDYPLEDPFETISSSIYPTSTAAVPLPDSLANLMAGIVNLMDEGIRVLDPCCGSGAFILSAARVSRERNSSAATYP